MNCDVLFKENTIIDVPIIIIIKQISNFYYKINLRNN